jgi:transcriptional regulator with XRE-family HTH domain
MADGASPLVQRRRLRAELRRARQERDLTQEQVASDMEWSLSKIIRIEGGSTGISANDLKALLRLYEITDPERTDQLTALARAARERSWWSAYRDVAPPALIQLIEYESAASVIMQFENMFVPGILQTEDYARVVLQDYYTEKPSSEQVSALVDLRVRREELLLERQNPPRFTFILDEAAVRRLIGGNSIMRSQIQRLIEIAKKPNVTIEIVPFKAGLHPGMGGPFEVIEFTDALDEDVVFLESPRGDIVSDNPEETLRYRETFGQLRKLALPERDSLAYLEDVASEKK